MQMYRSIKNSEITAGNILTGFPDLLSSENALPNEKLRLWRLREII